MYKHEIKNGLVNKRLFYSLETLLYFIHLLFHKCLCNLKRVNNEDFGNLFLHSFVHRMLKNKINSVKVARILFDMFNFTHS